MAITRSRCGDGLDAMSSSIPVADHCEDCFHMPVRTCACDAESLSCRDEGLALEGAFDDLDDVRGKMGEVAEGLRVTVFPLRIDRRSRWVTCSFPCRPSWSWPRVRRRVVLACGYILDGDQYVKRTSGIFSGYICQPKSWLIADWRGS